MDRGRGRTPRNRGRNPSGRRSPRSLDHSKHPLNPSPDSEASRYHKEFPSSSCEVDDESVKVTTCQPEQSAPDTSTSCSSKLVSKSQVQTSGDSKTKHTSKSPAASEGSDTERTNELHLDCSTEVPDIPMSTSERSSTSDAQQSGGQFGMNTSFDDAFVLIVSDKLNGSNYHEWAQAVKLAVGGRGKMGYLTGTTKIPEESNFQATQQWYADNSIVSSWLINAMVPQIKRSFMFLPTAHEIWEAIRDSYSDGEDLARLFEIKTRIWELKQGNRDVIAYWLEMSTLWQELDLMIDEEWACARDATRYKEQKEREHVFQFLAGLNKSLDDVRSRVLSRVPLPSTREVFSEVRRESSRRKVMMTDSTLPVLPTSDSAALVSRSSDTHPRGQRSKVTCDHCKKRGHSRDTCWDLHGKPPDWEPRKGTTRGYQTTLELSQETQLPHVDKEQLGKLIEMLNMLQKTEQAHKPNPIASIAHKVLVHPFDICLPKNTLSVVLKPSILERNRERQNEAKRNMNMTSRTVLRPGMIILKSYISLTDQVKIVERCQHLGVGPGGFYQPGYQDGRELHLKMMCLGKNWDPQTGHYGDHRPFDGARPPNIPDEFLQITKKAIKDSHVLLGNESEKRNPEKILPWMSPDICLVNFYTRNGRLDLHQDKDESEESLRQGLPVVSFSIGDAADFLFGDERDVDKAEKVVLESGDVLIFGGESRHIFHGVPVIHPNTAPKLLMEDTNLRPGRLNLTLRQWLRLETCWGVRFGSPNPFSRKPRQNSSHIKYLGICVRFPNGFPNEANIKGYFY